ncbi:hypothetical protein Q1695_005535 [Nippostrongylus brasiliensis]|nr:hypothetical protein Q1695_005535 [Nippostrongylus brasiliensis]
MNLASLVGCFLLLVGCVEITMSLSAEARLSLQQSHKGIDLETRRQRLRNLGGAPLENNDTLPEFTVLNSPVDATNVVNEASNLDTASIPAINQREGVDVYLYNGDIILSEKQLAELEMENSATKTPARRKRQVAIWAGKWPDNIVYYYFDASLSAKFRALVKLALKKISEKTCIVFKEDATATNRIRVFSGSGCYSALGMNGGEQDVSLGGWCGDIGVIAHEFMHSLGIRHMQNRPDRDDYLIVDLTIVKPDYLGQFTKASADGTMNYTPYDYGSVMHYAANLWTTNGKNSLVPRQARYPYTLGTRILSFFDFKMINDHFKCNDRCGADAIKCVNGGVPNPNNCAVCICPEGYGGPGCGQRPAGCGGGLNATAAWQTKTFSFGDSTSTTLRDDYMRCVHWIRAPAGKRPQVKVTAFTNVACEVGCRRNAIEPKMFTDKRVVSPRMCCGGHLNQALTTQLNVMPIISYNRQGMSSFTFQYRFVSP